MNSLAELTVVCVKTGTKYGPEYVNNLKAMVGRHLTVPHNFICATDDPTDCHCETATSVLPGWWAKLEIFKEKPFGIENRILFLDLDIVIRENIDCFAECEGFWIIEDWILGGYNSSVFVLDPGARKEVWERFDPSVVTRYWGDQAWIYEQARGSTFPADWCVSYRLNGPTGKIVVFHGEPKPHQVDADWVKREWHV